MVNKLPNQMNECVHKVTVSVPLRLHTSVTSPSVETDLDFPCKRRETFVIADDKGALYYPNVHVLHVSIYLLSQVTIWDLLSPYFSCPPLYISLSFRPVVKTELQERTVPLLRKRQKKCSKDTSWGIKGYWRRPRVWKPWRRQYLDPAGRERRTS
jgi:hypothetical protein